jgi:site-specific DNA-methyltransferase (adenine-specific)
MLPINKIYNMDCLEGMKLIDDNSIDSIVTDPPYELGFMGKKWDSTGIAYNVELWQEALRVLKPGGHLLAFGGTRTYHRMACAIEDAGFEIRDQMQWIYGSGFPKSMDISKAIDKKFGAVREVVGQREDILKKQAKDLKEGKRKIVDSLNAGASERNNGFINVSADITAPSTDEAKQWDGWGTALKPANEPIVVARKPLSEKTVAENVLKWGTGGLNIDGCRVGWKDERDRKNGWRASRSNDDKNEYSSFKSGSFGKQNEQGRFPANVILDEEAGKLLDEQSGILKSGALKPYQENHQNASSYKMNRYKTFVQPANEGGASRFFFNVEQDDLEDLIPFFYCAKASKKERGEGNTHPTVKPLKLISYLITLVTPPNGICLDIFEGSGTHALACIENGFKYIGFELDKHYFDIATKRISNHHEQLKII